MAAKKKTKTTKTTARKPRASTKSKAAPAKKAKVKTVKTVVTKLPGSVQKNEYVRRTADILDDTQRQATRLSKRTGKKLGGVATDLREDLSTSLEEQVDKLVKKTKLDVVKERFDNARSSTLKAFDDLLASIGLVRKAVL